MPLITSIDDFSNGLQLAIWRADGNEVKHLQQTGLAPSWWTPPENIVHPRRQLEWLAARAAAVHLLQAPQAQHCTLSRGKEGQPVLAGCDLSLSLTHSKGYAAAVLGNGLLGVDLEQIQPEKSLESASMFMRKEELDWFRSLNKEEALNVFYLIWSTKEGLYKALNRKLGGGLSFRKHLRVRLLNQSLQTSQVEMLTTCSHPNFEFHQHKQMYWRALKFSNFWLTWGRIA